MSLICNGQRLLADGSRRLVTLDFHSPLVRLSTGTILDPRGWALRSGRIRILADVGGTEVEAPTLRREEGDRVQDLSIQHLDSDHGAPTGREEILHQRGVGIGRGACRGRVWISVGA